MALPTGPRGLLTGASYVPRGTLFLLRHPKAWPYALLPVLFNGLLFAGFVIAGWFLLDDVHAWMLGDPAATDLEGWRRLAGGSLSVLAGIASFLLLLFTAIVGTFLVGALLAGPFQEKLSEVIEELATGQPLPDEPFSLRTLSMDALGAFRSAVERLGIFAVIFVPLFALSLVPVVGLIGAAGALLYTAFFLALGFVDPILSRRRIPLKKKIGHGRRLLAPWMGFGFALLAMLLIPVLQLLASPALVTAGTLLWLDAQDERGG